MSCGHVAGAPQLSAGNINVIIGTYRTIQWLINLTACLWTEGVTETLEITITYCNKYNDPWIIFKSALLYCDIYIFEFCLSALWVQSCHRSFIQSNPRGAQPSVVWFSISWWTIGYRSISLDCEQTSQAHTHSVSMKAGTGWRMRTAIVLHNWTCYSKVSIYVFVLMASSYICKAHMCALMHPQHDRCWLSHLSW